MVRKGLPAIIAVAIAALAVFAAGSQAAGGGSTATVTVSGTQWGVSSCYIGATEGNVNFNINDFTDLGINTYRVYGGMSRWEQQDDDGVFGSPTIAQIKANPSVINWAWWDNAITNPPNGTDYWWSGTTGLWQGSAATMLGALHNAGVRVVMTLRNVDNNNNPAWAEQQLNPPNTTAGQNEWWEHVFATVYELDVRNNFGIDDWEVHNEPDNSSQGWGGTLTDYENFVNLTSDAIKYVYATYLPGRTPHIYAPVTTGGSSWPNSVMQAVPGAFDSVDVHDYNSDITSYVTTVRGQMAANGFGSAPLWLSEWGTYRGGYNTASKGVGLVITNLIRMSSPSTYVYGSHLFSLYDWSGFSGGFQNFQGLINGSGTRLSSYYALRIATRALVGCRPTYQSTSTQGNLTAITTKDASGAYYVLIANNAGNTSYTTTVDLSALKTTGAGTEWQYDATHNDVIVATPSLSAGKVTVTVPGTSAILLKF